MARNLPARRGRSAWGAQVIVFSDADMPATSATWSMPSDDVTTFCDWSCSPMPPIRALLQPGGPDGDPCVATLDGAASGPLTVSPQGVLTTTPGALPGKSADQGRSK